MLSGHSCRRSLSTRLGADRKSPPRENGFQLKSMGCLDVERKVEMCSSPYNSIMIVDIQMGRWTLERICQ